MDGWRLQPKIHIKQWRSWISSGLVSSQNRQFCFSTYPKEPRKLGSDANCSRANTVFAYGSLPSLPGLVVFRTTSDPKQDTKFAKLWSAKSQVLGSDGKTSPLSLLHTLTDSNWAMLSTNLAFRRRMVVGWLYTEPVDSNLSTTHSAVFLWSIKRNVTAALGSLRW